MKHLFLKVRPLFGPFLAKPPKIRPQAKYFNLVQIRIRGLEAYICKEKITYLQNCGFFKYAKKWARKSQIRKSPNGFQNAIPQTVTFVEDQLT